MNICLVGSFSGNADEGMKLVAKNLAQELEKSHNVLKLDMYKSIMPNTVVQLGKFHPDVLHYVSGPSPFSFILLRALMMSQRIYPSHVRTVMSATQPWLPLNSASFCCRLKPDLMLVQSDRYEEFFKNLGFRVKSLPNGVDTQKFRPVKDYEKKDLRVKYGLDPNQFVALHVGPIRTNRGLSVMKSLANIENCTVLIVGSTTSPLERKVLADLTENKCVVWRKYIKSIQEIYQMSDLYVFPVENILGSIEVPLSVLEAMSCNLPVITTRFGGFPRLFTEGNGFSFVNSWHEILEKARSIIDGGTGSTVRTREKVLAYSWDNVARVLYRHYQELLDGNNRPEV